MRNSVSASIFVGLACLILSACSESRSPTYFSEDNPEKLSDWGMLARKENALSLSEGVTPYELATPLFSDYAAKLRTVWMPDGASAQYHETDTFSFPIGTVITKTFYYKSAGLESEVLQTGAPSLQSGKLSLHDVQLMETRLLVRREAGWTALPYVWNEEQTEAFLMRTGDIKELTLIRDDGRHEAFNYLVPNTNQCGGCHVTNGNTRLMQPIGPKARHLNTASTLTDGANQLDHWRRTGLLSDAPAPADAPQNAVWTDQTATLDDRARAYLDANCSHCHNPTGPADTSGLNLEPDATGPSHGRCKSPIAAGRGTGGRPFDIVPGDAEQSITVYRLQSTDPGEMMPELGRAVTHEEGVSLIAAWIDEMEGDCS